MHITVFGATGMVGKQVVLLGLARGFSITAFGRNINDLLDKESHDGHFKAMKGYVFDATDVQRALAHADAVISVLGGDFSGADKTRSLGMKNIVEQMQKTNCKRIIALGGMGILDDKHGEYILNAPDYPEEYKPVGREHLEAYQYLQASTLDWSFVCAPNIIDAGMDGKYITSASHTPEPNLYKISSGNLADCMLSEIMHPKYIHQRIGISNS